MPIEKAKCLSTVLNPRNGGNCLSILARGTTATRATVRTYCYQGRLQEEFNWLGVNNEILQTFQWEVHNHSPSPRHLLGTLETPEVLGFAYAVEYTGFRFHALDALH